MEDDRTATDRTATGRTATDRTATDRTATDRTATDGTATDRTATDGTATDGIDGAAQPGGSDEGSRRASGGGTAGVRRLSCDGFWAQWTTAGTHRSATADLRFRSRRYLAGRVTSIQTGRWSEASSHAASGAPSGGQNTPAATTSRPAEGST